MVALCDKASQNPNWTSSWPIRHCSVAVTQDDDLSRLIYFSYCLKQTLIGHQHLLRQMLTVLDIFYVDSFTFTFLLLYFLPLVSNVSSLIYHIGLFYYLATALACVGSSFCTMWWSDVWFLTAQIGLYHDIYIVVLLHLYSQDDSLSLFIYLSTMSNKVFMVISTCSGRCGQL